MLEYYSVYDKKVGAYKRPFNGTSLVDVTRSIEQEVKNPESLLSRYPGDFALYKLGSFDEIEGIFIQSKPEHLAEISAFINPLKGDNNAPSK